MDSIFTESRPIMPKDLTLITAGVLLATLAFMAISRIFMDIDMPLWTVLASAVLFIAVIVVLFVLKMDVTVSASGVEIVYAFRKIQIPAEEIIDLRKGELGDIRNYANWNLKGVKHRSFTCIGDDFGVALKLLGKRVVVFSTTTPDEAFEAISSIRKEE